MIMFGKFRHYRGGEKPRGDPRPITVAVEPDSLGRRRRTTPGAPLSLSASYVWGTGLGRLPREAADLLVISVIGCVSDVPGCCWYP